MKKSYILILFFLIGLSSYSQPIKRINDPHIRAQENRMVYKKWGNFLPNPDYNFFGIQTNFHYTMTWGWFAPAQNRRYRNGSDIRPLGPKGEQTQRMLSNTLLNDVTEKYREESDEIGKTALSELYYYSGLFSSVDPLWNLYYKIELANVIDYDKSKKLSNNLETVKYLKDTGVTEWYQGEMERFQDRLVGAFKTNMDRGDRILNYHRIMKEYYLVKGKLGQHLTMASTMIKLNKRSQTQNSGEDIKNAVWGNKTDRDIMQEVLKNSN